VAGFAGYILNTLVAMPLAFFALIVVGVFFLTAAAIGTAAPYVLHRLPASPVVPETPEQRDQRQADVQLRGILRQVLGQVRGCRSGLEGARERSVYWNPNKHRLWFNHFYENEALIASHASGDVYETLDAARREVERIGSIISTRLERGQTTFYSEPDEPHTARERVPVREGDRLNGAIRVFERAEEAIVETLA